MKQFLSKLWKRLAGPNPAAALPVPREKTEKLCEAFMTVMSQQVKGINLHHKVIENYKFTLYYEAPFIYEQTKLEVFWDRVWISEINTKPQEHGHGTRILNGIVQAALAIDVHRIECRPVNKGKDFFGSKRGFNHVDFSQDPSRKGILEKLI